MVAVNDVPQLVDKNGGSYAAIAPKLEPGKFNKWKKVVIQDLRLKAIIMSCLPDDIMRSVISCVSAKEIWTDLVHSFEGPSDTKENRIMDLKLECQTFKAKSTESLSQTYTLYKTLLNELANDGVNLSKHEINLGFVNSLPEKWLTFSQGLRNANHTQTLADIYERFFYEDNLIQRRYSDTKKALITTPSSTSISTAFFFNNVIQDFQENSDDEVYERTSEEYLRDLDIEYHERALLANSKCHFARDCFSKTSKPSYKSPVNNYSSVSKGFQPKFTPTLIQSSSNLNNQADQKFQKDYKAEYKKMKAKLSLLEATVSVEEEVTVSDQGTVALADNENENIFAPTSMGYVQEMVPKAKDWVERLNLDSKLPNFNTRRILVPKSQDVNESLETSNILESSKDSEVESLTPLPSLKILQGALPSSEILRAKAKPFPPCIHCGFNDHIPDDCRNYPECEIRGSYDHSTSGHNRVIQIKGVRHIMEPIWYLDSGCSRSMTGVKSYLHKYVEQPGPKVVFGDNSSCITEGYGSINYGGIVFTKVAFVNVLKYNLISISQLCDAKYIIQFDDKQRTIFNANKEIVLISPRRNDVYVLDMSSLTPNEARFSAKASKSVNWLWHKRPSHLNFKNINKLAKQNKVLGLPSLVYSKDKPCTTCEKEKHHKASFKTKQNFSIRKCLHILHMDLFGPVSPMSINHEKYTQVIVDEYSRSNKSEQIMELSLKIMSLRIYVMRKESPKISLLPIHLNKMTAERKNKTLIKAARTMLNGSVLCKHLETDAVRIACYTQNRLIIVKRHDKTSYEIFRERIPDISYFHVFGCPVFIHNHKDHLGKFDAKADDRYFLGYSPVSKDFRVYNTRRQ
ncbi:retrovirus-related pol polyprotein from transposon TNT 1-94 [Tanacetum coccineum]